MVELSLCRVEAGRSAESVLWPEMWVEVGDEDDAAVLGAGGAVGGAAGGGGEAAGGDCGAYCAADCGQRSGGDDAYRGAAAGDAEVWRGRGDEGGLSRGGRGDGD